MKWNYIMILRYYWLTAFRKVKSKVICKIVLAIVLSWSNWQEIILKLYLYQSFIVDFDSMESINQYEHIYMCTSFWLGLRSKCPKQVINKYLSLLLDSERTRFCICQRVYVPSHTRPFEKGEFRCTCLLPKLHLVHMFTLFITLRPNPALPYLT